MKGVPTIVTDEPAQDVNVPSREPPDDKDRCASFPSTLKFVDFATVCPRMPKSRPACHDRAPRRIIDAGEFVLSALIVTLIFLALGCRSKPVLDSAAGSTAASSVIGTENLSAASLGTPVAQKSFHNPASGKRDTQRLLELVSAQTKSFSDDLPAPQTLATSGVQHALKDGTDQAWDLTEAVMVEVALQNSSVIRSLGVRVLSSPQSVSTDLDPSIQATDPQFGPQAALAAFDSQLNASLTTQNNDRVFNNATLGGQVQELVQDYAQFESGWRKRTTLGTQWDVRSLHLYDSNNRAGNSFPSYWETQLEMGVRQPLMRGAGRSFNLIAGPDARPGLNFSNGIWIARINHQISQSDFEIQLRDYFLELYTAYWQLHRLYQSHDSIREARDVAYQIWQTVQSKKQTGLLGGEAYKEAQTRSQYLRYQRELDLALHGSVNEPGILQAERALRRLMGLPMSDGRRLRPADLATNAPFAFPLDESTSRAMQHRTELKRQRLEVQQRNLEVIAAKNFLLPQLDMIGRARIRGFGDHLTGEGPRFASAADDFFSLDHTEWEFGVEMGVSPLRRQAKAGVRNAMLQLQRERTILEEQQHAVVYEVHDAISNVASSYNALQHSIARAKANDERLASSRALYDAGKIQLEFLVDAAEQRLQAQRQLHLDQSNYSVSLVQVSRAMGTLLRDIGVHSHCE
ncbi:TolC family protein [Rhodopirellula halodulae]|uniref:TolC family protein n=1 Tax=Rhodopirellula halodulae TaxID=2894198 RepID=UPI001E33D686|nr:TolC family protein [Rhodopirellula sp. JC737]